jgi:DNA-binding transcriptional LysR family regulator
MLTNFSIMDDVAAGRLVRLLPGWKTAPAAIQAIFPSARYTSGKIRAFVEAVKTQWQTKDKQQ